MYKPNKEELKRLKKYGVILKKEFWGDLLNTAVWKIFISPDRKYYKKLAKKRKWTCLMSFIENIDDRFLEKFDKIEIEGMGTAYFENKDEAVNFHRILINPKKYKNLKLKRSGSFSIAGIDP